jgi:hypothetical protein
MVPICGEGFAICGSAFFGRFSVELLKALVVPKERL